MLTDSQIEAAAEAFHRARSDRKPLSTLPPENRPTTLGEAYRIQRAYDRRAAESVAGYKIGAASAASQKLVNATEPFLARVFASACFKSRARLPHSDFFLPGVEAEYAFEIGSDLPPRAEPYVRDEIAAAISAVHPVIEICDNRFTDWRSTDLMQIIADNGFFGALVVGKRETNWRTADLGLNEVVMKVDGEVRGRGCCEAVLGNPIDGVVWMANELSRQSIGLAKGQLVPIGTWTGLHFVSSGSRVVAEFGALGAVEVAFA
jgi:2-keto-4-pentenoate hydratase